MDTVKYGVPPEAGNFRNAMVCSPGLAHPPYYDAMFTDIRVQPAMKSGDPVKPEHLE
jgi:hypothetical protein